MFRFSSPASLLPIRTRRPGGSLPALPTLWDRPSTRRLRSIPSTVALADQEMPPRRA